MSNGLVVLAGDCREMLKTLPAESVHCCVTSPPYWRLRDYGCPNQIGREPTPGEYVAALRAVFAEVWRVLRKDGTLWLNLGDTYASAWPCERRNVLGNGSMPDGTRKSRLPRLGGGIKEKDLIGIPWMVALALRADGWYLRSDIIWHKPNPMPESMRDRPTKAHEYLFLFSKSPKYFYDAEAIREIGKYPAGTKAAKGSAERAKMKGVNARPPEYKIYDGFRNKRTVWNVPTVPYPGAHFATFPPNLIRPCVLAATSEAGCCPQCGTPWTRCRERAGNERTTGANKAANDCQPTCRCFPRAANRQPCLVLDPFAGSGTTGQVALELGRKAVLIEANSDYLGLIGNRCSRHIRKGSSLKG
jgi:DNA modification methylase